VTLVTGALTEGQRLVLAVVAFGIFRGVASGVVVLVVVVVAESLTVEV
jgi:hypothetical protein